MTVVWDKSKLKSNSKTKYLCFPAFVWAKIKTKSKWDKLSIYGIENDLFVIIGFQWKCKQLSLKANFSLKRTVHTTHTSASAIGSGSAYGSGSAFGIGSPNYQWTKYIITFLSVIHSLGLLFRSVDFPLLLTTNNVIYNNRTLFDNILNENPILLSTRTLMTIEWWSLCIRCSYLNANFLLSIFLAHLGNI